MGVEKETTERHLEPARSAAIHTSAAKDTAINTGVMDAQAREVGEIVETATVSRNVVPSVGPKIELPLDHADISTNHGTTTLNVGTVGKASQVVGEVVDTEVVSRDLEETHRAAAAPAVHPHHEAIATGVVGRTAQQVAEVHERETLERDLHSVHGASAPVAAGAATEAHVPTGKIDQATRAVGEVVETKTKERDVEAIHGAAPTAVAHKTHVEGVDTGVVAAAAKEVGEVVETHTTSRDMHNMGLSKKPSMASPIGSPVRSGITA